MVQFGRRAELLTLRGDLFCRGACVILDEHYEVLLVGHGEVPPASELRKLIAHSQQVIALDGGTNILHRLRVVPHIVLGDMDSVSGTGLRWAERQGARIMRLRSQADSDFLKGLSYCKQAGLTLIAATGISGSRIDHLLSAMNCACQMKGLRITVFTSHSTVNVLCGRASRRWEMSLGTRVSWIPITACRGCSLSGVRWPLKNRVLAPAGLHSLSNESRGNTVELRQSSGCSLFILDRKIREGVPKRTHEIA